MTNEELAPEEKRPTAAELKAQIEEKQRELKAQAKAEPVSEPANQAPVSQEPSASSDPASAAPVSTQDKPSDPAASSAADAETVPSQEGKAGEVPEIVKKKGWKDYESFLKSYAELEKKLGQRKVEPQAPVLPPQGFVPPFYGQQPVNPGVYPNQPSPNVMNQIARMYPQLAPEDIERVAPLIADLSETIADRKFRALEERLAQSERERQRRDELESLKQQPAFKNPEVLSEIGLILESNPQLAAAPNGLTYAYKEALANVGLKRLEGSDQNGATSKPSGSVLPTKPPTTARGTSSGTSAGSPGIKASLQIDPATFSGLPLAEKQRILKSIGAIREE